MGSRKRVHRESSRHSSSKNARISDGSGNRARMSPALLPLLDMLEERLRDQSPVLPLLREELLPALDDAELRRPDVELLIRGLVTAGDEARGEEEALSLLRPLLTSEFLLGTLLRFVVGLGLGDREAVGEVAALLLRLTLAFPQAVEPLIHLPADLLWTRLRRLGLELPWPTRKHLCDLKRAVDQAFPQGQDWVRELTFSEERPKDIADLPIFPTSEELLGSPDPWLKPNMVDGAYYSNQANHGNQTDLGNRAHQSNQAYHSNRAYLDTHFRLLREDLVKPLREKLAACLSPAGRPHHLNGGAKVYRDVRVLYPDCQRERIIYKVSFDAGVFGRGPRLPAKRLAKGSMVCLWAPRCPEVFPALVAKQDEEQLARGRLWLRFEGAAHPSLSSHLYAHSFSMVESPPCPEAHRHVLRGLQEADPASLPFQRYVVKCNGRVRPPRYLQTRGTGLDMRPLLRAGAGNETRDGLEERAGWMPGTVRVSPENTGLTEEFISIADRAAEEEEGGSGQKWAQPGGHPGPAGRPSAQTNYVVNIFKQDLRSLPWLKHFDKSQLKAIQRALSREFVLIQGSPGTGKTFVGLKLVELLLHNGELWQGGEGCGQGSPILVVCNNNNTLDLFLEGLLEANCSKIVRIGSFCKNKRLFSLTLENIRSARLQGMLTPVLRRRFKEIKEKIEKAKADIQDCSKILELLPLGILDEKELAPEMQDDMSKLGLSSIPLSESGSGIILEWLEIPQHLWSGSDAESAGADREQAGGEYSRYFPYKAAAAAAAGSIFTVLDGDDEDGSEPGERPGGAQLWAREKFAYVLGKNARDEAESTIQRCLSDHSVMSAEEVQEVVSIWQLPLDDRWRLYRKWRAAYQEKLNAAMNGKLEQYESLARDLTALDLEETLMLLGEAAVVGMTTLGTARNRTLLQRLRPRVVILEEAAEILEAQVMTMLTPACQHLIMISDQPQVGPKVADQELAAETHLNASLFERMVRNHIPFMQLRQQHRKGSDVSKLKFHPTTEDRRSVSH